MIAFIVVDEGVMRCEHSVRIPWHANDTLGVRGHTLPISKTNTNVGKMLGKIEGCIKILTDGGLLCMESSAPGWETLNPECEESVIFRMFESTE